MPAFRRRPGGLLRPSSTGATPERGAPRARAAERGQVLAIFAGGIVLFMLLMAVVVDVSWYWANTLRVQRAADAAALAGAVYLPGNVTAAVASARAEATKNGYANGSGGVVVTPTQDSTNSRQLNVRVSAPVGTYFMRVIGITSINATRTSKAEYVLPVPMGSPENYYGTYGTVRTAAGGTYTYDTTREDSGWLSASATKGTNSWTTPGNVYTSNDRYATTRSWDLPTSSTARQAWGNFGITFPSGGNISSVTVRGIEVGVEASRAGSGTATDCRFQLNLSWNNGSSWTSGSGTGAQSTPVLTTSDPADPYYVLGSSTDLWGRTAWTTGEMGNANLQVRAQPVRPRSNACDSTITGQLDHLRVRITYDVTRSTFHPDTAIAGPHGEALNARGFWATMLTAGAETINGDAYLPYYDTRTSGRNSKYNQDEYYNYAVEMPPGATNGEVWLFDPGFCHGDMEFGVGDNWVSGTNPVSAYYDLYDTLETPYNLADDVLVASSGTLFEGSTGKDADLTSANDGSGPTGCDAYHLDWYRLASGLSGGAAGRTYRLHTYNNRGTGPNQLNANARNGFAIFVNASGGTGSPRTYGIGAMEMFTPLPGGQASEFYLAQIDPVHAGKTMEINLWDAGDTNQNANIQILGPTGAGWSPATFSYTSSRGTTNSGACSPSSGNNVTSVVTYSGGSKFNGCWLTITIPIPASYTGPQDGWWKIRYNMTGTGNSTDITTWEVNIRGNPVHLKVP